MIETLLPVLGILLLYKLVHDYIFRKMLSDHPELPAQSFSPTLWLHPTASKSTQPDQ